MATEKKEKLDSQIKSADMSEEMQRQAVEVAEEAMSKFQVEKDIAQYIKKEGLHGIALLEGILEASSHTKQSILSTSIWDIARFYFLRLNDFWELAGKNNEDAEKRDLS